MSSKIVLIACWFGKIPPWFDLWCLSVKENAEFDWIFITDQKIEINLPDNLHIVNMTMQEIKDRVEKKLHCKAEGLTSPYKLCDLRPAYGLVFSEELSRLGNCTHWGHCDIDLIFGDIKKFVTDEMLSRYDKIYARGHLCIYKNTDEVNKRCFDKNSAFPFKTVLNDPSFYAFDEVTGIERIYRKNNVEYICNYDYVDISVRYPDCFRLNLNIRERDKKYQAFFWEDGKILRAFENDRNEIETDEWSYLHFQKKKLPNLIDKENINAFWITPWGFFEKKEQKLSREILLKYNKTLENERIYTYRYIYTKVKDFLKKPMHDKYIHIRQKNARR